ncbi:ubiquitin-like-conjugating enzyme ATG10 [Episyrphus balteatus]|uniref:ubiquitin-like-conjugating enzyme ATG10 n=1 Tax=Episyrphus balteatus TaxID=286459 RepID=UPI0024856AFD|nr:ubiquitin-like-conjugating enzyme ATG10 [Episyrphus balteatus]XP_055837553.1 ubiquitin-like-conjugating enzyme ATG10 [Episyrphus balteatus]
MCSITWCDFLKSVNEFIELSKTCQDDNWSIVEKDNNEGNTYLVYKQKINVQLDEIGDKVDLIEDLEIEEIHQDLSSKVAQKIKEELFEMEYHVVYSISYQVPVLYFKGYRNDGKPITLEDAWKIFQNHSGDSKSRSTMLSTLTQTDHPVLFTPFLELHPCRTAELLKQMGVSENSILTFLSIMGPFVKLNLKNEYGLAFKK